MLGLSCSCIQSHGHLGIRHSMQAVHEPGRCMLVDEALLLLSIGLGQIVQEPLLMVSLGLCLCMRVGSLGLDDEVVIACYPLLPRYALKQAWLHSRVA